MGIVISGVITIAVSHVVEIISMEMREFLHRYHYGPSYYAVNGSPLFSEFCKSVSETDGEY